MSIPVSHVLHQGPTLGAFLTVLLSGLGRRARAEPPTPGPLHARTLPPRDPRLVADYIRWTGGQPDSYPNQLPPHLFPQWGFPLLVRSMRDLPWPTSKVLNQGCRLTVQAPLPADEPLMTSVQLAALRVEPHRARITHRLMTGTATVPAALIAEVHMVVPLARRKKGGPRREPPTVPGDAVALSQPELAARAGLDFALLTGDFNPIHWIGPAARMAGFPSVILHGFACLALAFEAVVHGRLGGEVQRLAELDVRFVKPLPLPAQVGIFAAPPAAAGEAIALSMGTAPGERATMLGHYQEKA